MQLCDISLVDEFIAKLWLAATSLFPTDWMTDSQDIESLITCAHWQEGTLWGHFTGDKCQCCPENDTWYAFIFFLSLENVKIFHLKIEELYWLRRPQTFTIGFHWFEAWCSEEQLCFNHQHTQNSPDSYIKLNCLNPLIKVNIKWSKHQKITKTKIKKGDRDKKKMREKARERGWKKMGPFSNTWPTNSLITHNL